MTIAEALLIGEILGLLRARPVLRPVVHSPPTQAAEVH